MQWGHSFALLALLSAACADPSPLPPQSKSPATAGEFYADSEVWHIDLQLSAQSYQALQRDPRTYVVGAIRIGETLLSNVGVRLKGAYSFQDLSGKSSFKVKFNVFDRSQRFLGLEKLTLNNMRQDRSQLHEWASYQIFASAGVPAARSGFAAVSLNGTYYGLYANVETMDDRFLADRFGDEEGNLYEAPWGADLEASAIDMYEQDEGEDRSRADLDALLEQVETLGDSVFFGAQALVDTDEFLRFVAAEAISGHWDGYWKANNYFLYHETPIPGQGQGLWSFLPWGMDMTFGQELDPYASQGVLAKKCFALPSCLAQYTKIGLEVVDLVQELALAQRMPAMADRIDLYVQEDTRGDHPPAKVRRYQDIMSARLNEVFPYMRERFSCLQEGVEVDLDQDGFGACRADCNDSDASAFPGGTEVCDGVDNDCDGQVDEVDCPCNSHRIEGQEYLFCDARVPHSRAQASCEVKGAQLALFQSESQGIAAFEIARSIQPTLSWHLAATDSETEGQWLDLAEQPLQQTFFAPGEPDDFGGEHCMALASFAAGDWEDLRCSTLLPYICKVLP